MLHQSHKWVDLVSVLYKRLKLITVGFEKHSDSTEKAIFCFEKPVMVVWLLIICALVLPQHAVDGGFRAQLLSCVLEAYRNNNNNKKRNSLNSAYCAKSIWSTQCMDCIAVCAVYIMSFHCFPLHLARGGISVCTHELMLLYILKPVHVLYSEAWVCFLCVCVCVYSRLGNK